MSLDFYAIWDAKTAAATPTPFTAAVIPIGEGRGQRYAARALADEAAQVAGTPEGSRNARLNIAAVKLGGLVAAGHLDRADVIDTLTQAAHAAGLTPTETAATIHSGLAHGAATPRDIPDLPPTPEATPWATPTTPAPAAAGASTSSTTATAASGSGAPSAAPGDQPEADPFRDGASFILDAPEKVPVIWGDDDDVLWAQGEALMIVGPPGVGKTTLIGQVLRARLGIGTLSVLGLPVVPTDNRVLYLAMDRPAQIARALRRTFDEAERPELADRLRVWEGPPPADIAHRPALLLEMARHAEADTIIIDSLKDAAVGLSEDEVGAGYNRARQGCLAAGVQVIELHHLVKRGPNGTKPNTLADVYGSAWLTAGAGSVVLLWGAAGDPIVELLHLKQPAGEVGPLRVIHDHTAGTSRIEHEVDLLAVARLASPGGLIVHEAAVAMFAKPSPTRAEVEKARRRLERLVRDGLLDRLGGAYKIVTHPVTALLGGPLPVTVTHPVTDVTGEGKRAGQSVTHGVTGVTHASKAVTSRTPPPPYRGGVMTGDENEEEPEDWWQR